MLAWDTSGGSGKNVSVRTRPGCHEPGKAACSPAGEPFGEGRVWNGINWLVDRRIMGGPAPTGIHFATRLSGSRRRGTYDDIVIDGLHARYNFDRHPQRLLLRRRIDDSPQVDCAVGDGHIDETRPHPRLRSESRHHLLAQLSVRDRLWLHRLLAESGKRLNEIGATDDADEPAVLDDRHPLDPMPLKQRRDVGNGRVGRGRYHLPRHKIAYPAAVLPQKLAGQKFATCQH